MDCEFLEELFRRKSPRPVLPDRSSRTLYIHIYIIIYHISNYIEETRNWNEKEEGSVEIFPSPVCLRVSGLDGTRETIPMDN